MHDFNKIIDRKNTCSIQYDFTQQRYGKEGLLSFGISDMDFQSPKEIITSLKQRVEHGIFGYSGWDCDDYKNSIKHWLATRFNYNLNTDLITYSPNLSYAISHYIKILNPKFEPVILFTPSYNGFFNMLNLNKIPWNQVHINSENNQYTVDFNQLEQYCKTSKLLLLCNPNNPNGKIWSKTELITIVEICKKHNVVIVSDEMYMDFVHKPHQFISLLPVLEKLDYTQNAVILTSASKTFNTPGLSGAYTITYNQSARNSFLDLLKNQDNFIFALALTLPCLITGYNHCAYWIDDVNQYVTQNLHFLNDFLKKNLPMLNFVTPDSGYFAWINCQQLNLSHQELQTKLMSQNLGIPSGESYQEKQVYLRLNVGCPKAKLEQGLQKLILALT